MTTRLVGTALVVAGASFGAVLGGLPFTLEGTWRVLGPPIAIVVGVLLATAVTGRGDPVPSVVRRPTPARQRAPEPAPARPDATARVVLDTGPAAAGGGWWTQTGAPPRPPGEANPAAAPRGGDLSGYVESARVVQCPRCGSFRIDVTGLTGGYSFRCRDDDHAWRWRPGTQWPATVVVSRPGSLDTERN